MTAPEVIYDPALDAPWYVVQVEDTVLNYNAQPIRTQWETLGIYNGDERAEAEERARDIYAQNLGNARVRVIRAGKGAPDAWPPYDH